MLEAAMPVPTAAPAALELPGSANSQAQTAEPPRLRQFFPETMLWLPDAVTDPQGAYTLQTTAADSITTWRLTALASTQDGRLGSVTTPLHVFQDFFIDLDLPLSLTVGDEVSIPVGVYNYLTEAQTVRLELDQAPWFELVGAPSQELTIAANDIQVAYFRIRAAQFGQQQPFKVTAWGSKMSDAIQKEVQVLPNGKAILSSQSDRLATGQPLQVKMAIPADAIPGTPTLTVKVYPGILSQVVEGLDSILRMPSGCFKQTSSSTYPNVLVLDYLKAAGKTSPEVQLKAEEYINLGYQRLTTFEVQDSGGFSMFGQPPADRMLTAYGLQEFADMSRVHPVDPALIQRAAQWLLSQQTSDGSWENDRGLVHENTWSSLGNDRLPVTAYITWSLVEAGFDSDPGTQKGLQYVRSYQSQAKDAYVVALVANALVSADLHAGGKTLDATTMAILDRLAGLAVQDGSRAYWQSGVATFMGSQGQTGSIETTALAALALLKAERYPELANPALTYLIQQKDNFGTWHNTQATVLSLKALIQSLRAGAEKTQATSSYYLPWDKLAEHADLTPQQNLVTIKVAYDRTKLAVNDTVTVNVTISLNQPGGHADAALIDLGLPPGFTLLSEDLDALVARSQDLPKDYAYAAVQRYEPTGRQILVYISNLSEGKPLQFSYRLRARFPLAAFTPASTAYDYYNPQVTGAAAPQKLVVAP